GRSLDDILPSLNGAFHERLDRARSEGTRELMEVEPEMDGQHRYWNVIMSPLRDENLVAQGVAIVLDDLTEIRQREEQLGIASRYMKMGLDSIRDIEAFEMGGQEREISVLHCDVRGFTS